MRILVRPPLVRRAAIASVALALLIPPAAAHAASDPLADAVARVTAATRAENAAVAAFDAAQADYYRLLDEQTATEEGIGRLRTQQQHLASLARMRAVLAYKRGDFALDDVFGSGSDVLDAARRATVLDRINEQGDAVISALSAVTDDLRARQSTLSKQIADAKHALASMKDQEHATERALADAASAATQLRVRLAAQQRQAEYAAIAARARAAARLARSVDSGGGSSSTGTSGQILVHGAWVCPVQGPVAFTDTFGAPRGNGRQHHGNDLFSPRGTPLVAVTAGSLWYQSDPLGGRAAYVDGNDGNTYYYAHLNDYVGGDRPVKAGELIGHVGNSGDASDGPTHLHFEIRPGGPNGRAIDPYPTLAAHCL